MQPEPSVVKNTFKSILLNVQVFLKKIKNQIKTQLKFYHNANISYTIFSTTKNSQSIKCLWYSKM